MPRQYPRFLFSNPQNTKSKGPFVVSLIEPIIICRAHLVKHRNQFCNEIGYVSSNKVAIELLETPYKSDERGVSFGMKIEFTMREMLQWLHFQYENGELQNWTE